MFSGLIIHLQISTYHLFIIAFVTILDLTYSKYLNQWVPPWSLHIAATFLFLWVRTPSPQLWWAYCHWLLSRHRVCWLAGTRRSHLQLAHYVLHVPPPPGWNGVEQWRSREEGGARFVSIFGPVSSASSHTCVSMWVKTCEFMCSWQMC